MKYILIQLLVIMTISLPAKIGDKCQCQQLFTENECEKITSCVWDNILMKCKVSSDMYSQQFLLENLDDMKNLQTTSFFCNLFVSERCLQQKSCVWFKEKCSHFTGCTAYQRQTHEECQNISNLCISDSERCVQISNCQKYQNKFSCTKNEQQKFCVWDEKHKKCDDSKICSDLPKTLSTHDECQQQLNQCTVKEGGGCIELGYDCSDQKAEISCITNIAKTKVCFWQNGQCFERLCENASRRLQTELECQEFLDECTTKQGGGCMKKNLCENATTENACTTDKYGSKCFWNDGKCTDIICELAPSSYNTYELCQSLHKLCITNGNGCISNYSCEFAPGKDYCYQDSEGNSCIWHNNRCIRRTCQHADDSYIGHEMCEQFLFKCTGKQDGGRGCIEKTCQNAPIHYKTNKECQIYLPNNNCITKLSGGCQPNQMCFQIDTQEACSIDALGSKCYWIQEENKCYKISTCHSIKNEQNCIFDWDQKECVWQKQQCIYKSCETAPLELQTETQCQEYFKPSNGNICSTKKQGGCKIKTTCANQQTKESCTKDADGIDCFWLDKEQVCKNKECSDIISESFMECQQWNKQCTISITGKCQNMQFCQNISNKYECIQGLDGTCLWIDNYETINGKGKCFQYSSCESMKWDTDKKCKQISNYCTTNGYNCIPINKCSETNTNGGCVTGTEGQCIQTVKSLNSMEQPQCQQFINCKQGLYLTHEKCQKANSLCTTNGISGCIPLDSCDNYVKESCFINHTGEQKNDKNQILSTGKCIWDDFTQNCRNESCNDLKFTNKNDCSNALYSCTSNGEKCINKSVCSDYKNEKLCNYAEGMEGSCIWKGICMQKQCEDIKNGIKTEICQEVNNCISDGNKCVQKKNCVEYKTKIACNSIGLDGLCFWNETTSECKLMDNCNSANDDQNACEQAKDRCYWKPKTQLESSKCIQHTCNSFENQTGQCSHYLTWDWQSYNICKFVSFKCQSFDVQTLTQDNCLIYTLEMYRWNPISQSCSGCDTEHKKYTKQPVQEEGVQEVLKDKIISLAMSIILLFD